MWWCGLEIINEVIFKRSLILRFCSWVVCLSCSWSWSPAGWPSTTASPGRPSWAASVPSLVWSLWGVTSFCRRRPCTLLCWDSSSCGFCTCRTCPFLWRVATPTWCFLFWVFRWFPWARILPCRFWALIAFCSAPACFWRVLCIPAWIRTTWWFCSTPLRLETLFSWPFLGAPVVISGP